jgi:hypothetical protein
MKSTQKTDAGHSLFGGSVAARVLRCPASVGLIEKVPAYLRKQSAYANRGTACHAAMAMLLDDAAEHSPANLIGMTIGNYTLTRDDVENALKPAYAYVERLLAGAEYYLEHRVAFPGIADTFGTLDLLVRIADSIHVVDFKFGAQLQFYAAAARHSLPEFFADIENIVLTIVQPMSNDVSAEIMSTVEVSPAELDEFITVYRSACAEALGSAPRIERGPWCPFCAARPICPAHTAPLLDLAQLAVPTASSVSKEAYLQALAGGLNLVDAIKDLQVALRDQAKHALQSGDVVPGYALSAGRAERHWYDESKAIAALQELGLARDDILAEAMRSPKQVETRAKARGLKIPAELIGSARSGVSLVRAENVRAPVPGRSELVRSFTEALEAFQGGRQT